MNTSSRHNPYALIHKALRLAMTESLARMGRLDATDAREVSDAIVSVRELLQFCRHHVEIENTLVHPMIEARRPGSTARIADEHVGHAAAIASLERQVEALARAPSTTRASAAAALYASLAHFVGENFVHMHEEETVHNAHLWAAYDDDELRAMEATIRARQSPTRRASRCAGCCPPCHPPSAARSSRACAPRLSGSRLRRRGRARQGARRSRGPAQARARPRRLTRHRAPSHGIGGARRRRRDRPAGARRSGSAPGRSSRSRDAARARRACAKAG